jgi:hypothetical protein
MVKINEKTKIYTSFGGNKLLQHADVLADIQNKKEFRPVMIELCPTEVCNSDCPFCSVAGRPIKSYMPFETIKQVLTDFKTLGAKSLEITGGGNPMLYQDRETKQNINDIILFAHKLGYDIGLITNSHTLDRLDPIIYPFINWLRVSLIQLDEGREPEDYDFCGFPYEKLGFSYIVYDTGGEMDPLSRTKKVYQGSGVENIQRIARLVELHPKIKFVRMYGNCLIKGGHPYFKSKFESAIKEVDKHGKMFIKDVGTDDGAFDDSCFIGMLRPYIAANPEGGDYRVYICNSHVLNTRTYDLDYSLCSVKDIIPTWARLNRNYQDYGYPYSVRNNKGKDWNDTCKYCYYNRSNELLETITKRIPDFNFI